MHLPALQPSIAPLDALLIAWREQFGADFEAYRNHCHRVAHYCAAYANCTPDNEKLVVACAFHDSGIWLDRNFDYLPCSMRRAREWLEHHGHHDWVEEVCSIIGEHHKIRRFPGPAGWMTEAFRLADRADVSHGLLAHGLPREFIRQVQAAFPNVGLHRILLRLGWQRLRTHPLNPLPMFRW